MRQHPIYHRVTACNYQGDKSYGSVDTASTTVLVGSSKSNSHELCAHSTTKRYHDHVTYKGKDYHDVIVFSFGVDGTVLVRKIFKAKNKSVAGELIKTITVMNRIKGL